MSNNRLTELQAALERLGSILGDDLEESSLDDARNYERR